MWESWPRRCEAVLILKPCLSCYGPFRHFHWVSCGQRCTQWVTLTWALPQTGTCWNASCLGCQCPPPPHHIPMTVASSIHTTFSQPPDKGEGQPWPPTEDTELASCPLLPPSQAVILARQWVFTSSPQWPPGAPAAAFVKAPQFVTASPPELRTQGSTRLSF